MDHVISASAWNRLQAEFKNLSAEQKLDVLGVVFYAIGLDQWNETVEEELEDPDDPDAVMALFKTRLEQNSIIDGYIPWLSKQVRAEKLDTGTSRYYDVKATFRAICVWASETKTDIGRVSLEDALEKAKAYVPRAAKKGLEESDENPVVYRFADGYKVVNLKTDEALKLEGDRMKHCVGGYCSNVKTGTSVIYSLRSPDGDPKNDITLEYSPSRKTFVQMFGTGNSKPNLKQQKYLIEFIEAKFPHDKCGLVNAGKPAKDLDLKGAVLIGAVLIGANLKGANLIGTDLTDANLEDAYLYRAYLSSAVLEGANLTKANLIGASLTGANLKGADLKGADLRYAILEGAKLIDANLRGARLTGADLTGVMYNNNTIWPDGFSPPSSAIEVSAVMNVIEAAAPAKYKHINFKPPEGVRKAAKRGLEMRKEHGRGGTAVGVARARDLMNGKQISPSTARRMKAYFDRHQPDQKAEGFDSGEDGYPSAGRVAWELWGGDAGYSWAKKLVKQMNSADGKGKVKASGCGCAESCECGCQAPGGGQPPSDMTISNLKQIIRDAEAIMAVLHEDMEIMGWAEDKVSQAKAMVNSVRNYIENDFGGTTSASTSTKWPMYKEHWNPGEKAWFEYQCWESEESCDAELWKHTHQQVTIIGESDSDELCAVNSLDERIADACMKVYNVRFDDGFEYEVVEDELFTDKKYWGREDYPADEDDNSGGATSAAVKPWEEKRKPVHAFRDSSYDFGDFSCDECDSWERQWPLTRSTKHDVHCMSCGKPMLAKDAMDGECRSCYNEIEGSYTAIEKPTLTLASNRRSVAAALLAAADALSKGER